MGLKLFLYDSAEYDFNAPAKNKFDNAAGPGRRPAGGRVYIYIEPHIMNLVYAPHSQFYSIPILYYGYLRITPPPTYR